MPTEGELRAGPTAMSLRDVARRAGVTHAAANSTSVPATAPGAISSDVGMAYVRFAMQHRSHFEVMYRPELYHADDPALAGARAVTAAVPYDTDPSRRPPAGQQARRTWSIVNGLATLWLNRHVPRRWATTPRRSLALGRRT